MQMAFKPAVVLTDWELWACANEAIKQHAFNAPIFAAMRADELFEQGDEDGSRAWRQIIKRIDALLAPAASSLN